VVPEYRRAGMAEEGWTGTFNDIALICDQLTTLTEPHGVDPSRITWAGHSAGGHLALWAAARPYFDADSPWHGPCEATHVVSLAGCNSLKLCAQWNLGDGAAQNLLGGTPDEVPERYAAADPAALTPPSIPVTLVHGTADDRVPVGMSRACSIGRLIEIPGVGHFDLIDPHSTTWPHVLTTLTTTD
jgi:pimeloyl-ACP methyl ester carboxylesterase